MKHKKLTKTQKILMAIVVVIALVLIEIISLLIPYFYEKDYSKVNQSNYSIYFNNLTEEEVSKIKGILELVNPLFFADAPDIEFTRANSSLHKAVCDMECGGVFIEGENGEKIYIFIQSPVDWRIEQRFLSERICHELLHNIIQLKNQEDEEKLVEFIARGSVCYYH